MFCAPLSSHLSVSYEKTSSSGTQFTIHGVKVRGSVPNYHCKVGTHNTHIVIHNNGTHRVIHLVAMLVCCVDPLETMTTRCDIFSHRPTSWSWFPESGGCWFCFLKCEWSGPIGPGPDGGAAGPGVQLPDLQDQPASWYDITATPSICVVIMMTSSSFVVFL